MPDSLCGVSLQAKEKTQVMTTTNLHPTPSKLEQETGAIIRALQNILINDNPLNYRKDELHTRTTR